MKKILLAAAAALAITSCSQSEEFEVQNPSNEISFNTGVNNASRAVLTANDSFKAFTVYAYAHSNESFAGTVLFTLMDNVDYTRTITDNVPGNWSIPSKKYYWPASGKVSFFGYAGAEAGTYNKPESGLPTLTYTVNDDITKQEDLVVAQLKNQTKSENNSSVNLSFKHALTQVYFKLAVEDEDLTYEVSNIEIIGAKNKGVFTYGNDPLVSADWVTSGETTGTYAIVPGEQGKLNKITSTVALNDASTQTMVLLPQSLSGISIKVTYTASDANGMEVHAASEPLTWNLSGNWLPGQKIAYVLTLSGGDELTVTGGVDDDSWTEKTENN